MTEKKSSTVGYILRLTFVLLLITAVVAGLLGVVNYFTKDTIAELRTQKAKDAMEQVLAAESYTPMDCSDGGIVTEAFRADDLGYVVRVSPSGFGGAIDMMVGISSEGAVTGVVIVSHTETASLGANCTREEFRAQYPGAKEALSVDKDGGTIEALTGATVTSRAVTEGVNAALAFVKEVQE